VFDSEEDCFAAVKARRSRPGDVVVIRYEGPRGGPGMREMLHVTGALVGEGSATSRAAHRRPLLGRDARADGRPHRAGGGARRPDLPRSATATRSCRRRGRRSTSTCRTTSSRAGSRLDAAAAALHEGVFAKYARHVGSASEGARP
jgi:dihydroxy-acid dehydratase